MTSPRGKHFSSEPPVEFGEDTDQFATAAESGPSGKGRSKEPAVETLGRPASEETPARPEQHGDDGGPASPKKKRHVLRWVLIVLLVLVVLLAGAAVAALSYLHGAVQAGEESITQTIEEAKVKTPTITNVLRYKGVSYAPNESMVSIAFIGFDGNDSHGAGQADTVIVISLNTEDGSISAISIPRDSMVLLLGTDGRPGEEVYRSDSIILARVDPTEKQATLISIPRDSMVEVNEFLAGDFLGQETMQLCLAYSYGDGTYGSSRNVADLASRILYDIPVAYYFTLDLSGIGPLNDSIGGVTLTPLETIPNTSIEAGVPTTLWDLEARRYVQWRSADDIPLNDSIGGVTLTPLETIPNTSIEAGVPTTLWDLEARRYVQWRSADDITSSLARQDRQIQYLQAFATQIIEAAKGNPAVLLDLYNTAVQYSYTNLSFEEFSYLVTAMTSTGFSSVSVRTLPGEMVQGSRYAEFYLDKEGVRQAVLDTYYHVVDDNVNVDQVIEDDANAPVAGNDPTIAPDPDDKEGVRQAVLDTYYHVVDDNVNVDQVIEDDANAPVAGNDPTIAPDPDSAADGVAVEGQDVVETPL